LAPNKTEDDLNDNCVSLINLQRLGLIQFSWERNYSEYREIDKIDNRIRYIESNLFKSIDTEIKLKNNDLKVIYGIIRATSLGNLFIKVCF
jgi:hypothetical protein